MTYFHVVSFTFGLYSVDKREVGAPQVGQLRHNKRLNLRRTNSSFTQEIYACTENISEGFVKRRT